MRSLKKTYGCLGLFAGQRGNIALLFALSISALLLVLSFSVNTGYMFSEKNRRQNAVDAAALAGAVRLCSADAAASARDVFLQNLLPGDPLLSDFSETDLEVVVGFYDVFDAHGDFDVYKDFIEKDRMPLDEYENAVMVRLLSKTKPVVPGFITTGDAGEETTVAASSVAYLKRYSMVSLADDLDSLIWAPGFENGDVQANGNIIYPTESTPTLVNAGMTASGTIQQCKGGYYYGFNTPDWDKIIGAGAVGKEGVDKIEEIVPCDNGYVDTLKATADVVYEPAQAGTDKVFFGYCDGTAYMSGSGMDPINLSNCYLFDICEEPEERITYFFDASSDANANVILTTGVYSTSACPGVVHFPRGNRVSNVTFIANCRILLYNPSNVGITMFAGSTGDQQVIVISSDDIILHHSRSSAVYPRGISFRCGGDFYFKGQGGYYPGSPPDALLRIVADGRLHSDNNVLGTYDFMFGPPCPPTIAKLGRLETVSVP